MVEFICKRCGNCCRWSGYVRLSPRELEAAAAWLQLTVEEFADRYTALTADRRGLTLTETAAGHCILLAEDEEGLPCCRIQGAKPRQCRTFPLEWNFPGWEKECAGEMIPDGEKRSLA